VLGDWIQDMREKAAKGFNPARFSRARGPCPKCRAVWPGQTGGLEGNLLLIMILVAA